MNQRTKQLEANIGKYYLKAGLIYLSGLIITGSSIHVGFLFATLLVLIFGMPLTVAVLRLDPRQRLVPSTQPLPL